MEKVKSFKSPTANEMYAFATSKNGKTQRWFKSKESFSRFFETVSMDEYRIVKNKEYSLTEQ